MVVSYPDGCGSRPVVLAHAGRRLPALAGCCWPERHDVPLARKIQRSPLQALYRCTQAAYVVGQVSGGHGRPLSVGRTALEGVRRHVLPSSRVSAVRRRSCGDQVISSPSGSRILSLNPFHPLHPSLTGKPCAVVCCPDTFVGAAACHPGAISPGSALPSPPPCWPPVPAGRSGAYPSPPPGSSNSRCRRTAAGTSSCDCRTSAASRCSSIRSNWS